MMSRHRLRAGQACCRLQTLDCNSDAQVCTARWVLTPSCGRAMLSITDRISMTSALLWSAFAPDRLTLLWTSTDTLLTPRSPHIGLAGRVPPEVAAGAKCQAGLGAL